MGDHKGKKICLFFFYHFNGLIQGVRNDIIDGNADLTAEILGNISVQTAIVPVDTQLV